MVTVWRRKHDFPPLRPFWLRWSLALSLLYNSWRSGVARRRSTGTSDMALRAWSRWITILRLPACVSTFEAYVESLRSREGLVRTVRTVSIPLEFDSVSGSQRVFKTGSVYSVPLASDSETLDWSRTERARVVIGCRSACGNERWCRRCFSSGVAALTYR